jgi:glycosyltransferase involved in cell wall biosynthesis
VDKRVYIIPIGALSFRLQANLLADVVGGAVFNWPYLSSIPADTVIVIGNIDVVPFMTPKFTRFKKLIWYTVIEGDFPDSYVKLAINAYKPYIVVPSKYVKGLLEAHDIHVDEVIPHGIAYYPPNSIPKKDIDFLYIGEPQKRKIPPWAYPVLRALQDRLALVSDFSHPEVRKLKPKIAYQTMKARVALGYLMATDYVIQDLYSRSKFYLNVSANEGFGLTPLEAEAFGAIPIAPELPAFKETLGSCVYWVPVKPNDYELWRYDFLHLHLYHYDPKAMIETAESAKWSEDQAKECMLNASRYYYKDVYRRFHELI